MENRDWEMSGSGFLDNTPMSGSPPPDELEDTMKVHKGLEGGEAEVDTDYGESGEVEADHVFTDPAVDCGAISEPEDILTENTWEAQYDISAADVEQSEPVATHGAPGEWATIPAKPVYYAGGNGRDKKRVKKKHTVLKAICLTVAAIFVIAACEILSGYDIAFNLSDIGIEIVLRDREIEERIWTEDALPSGLPGDLPDIFSQDEPETDESPKVPVYKAGDGTTLEVGQVSGERHTLQEIYDRCIDSIVLVNVELEGGYGSGTGIIMSENGYIITNEHVIAGATNIDIELQDGTEYSAALVGADSQTDLAVLKIEAKKLLPASFGESTELRVGDEVAALGNPLGLNFSLSNGIISALDRDVEVNGFYMTMIQTNVAINEGNSGGALINMYGQVIGITNMKLVSYSTYSSIEGMAFAIPTSVVKPIVDSIIAEGYVKGRPALGIMCATLDAVAAESEGLPKGVYVSSIHESSGAYGKLESGDVITAANGKEVSTNEELNNIKNELSVGDTLTLTVYRDGETIDVDIILIDANLIEY